MAHSPDGQRPRGRAVRAADEPAVRSGDAQPRVCCRQSDGSGLRRDAVRSGRVDRRGRANAGPEAGVARRSSPAADESTRRWQPRKARWMTMQERSYFSELIDGFGKTWNGFWFT